MTENPSSSLENSLRIVVERNLPEFRLAELNIKSWPKKEIDGVARRVKFDAEETCYLVKGKVKVYPKGSSSSSSGAVEFGAGDHVTLPKGLSCTWDVLVAVEKYYMFQSNSASSSSS